MWHVSVSARSGRGEFVDVPKIAEAAAVAALRGVGGDHEWWLWNPATRVGHLRVPVTDDEHDRVPAGVVQHDAGDTGPVRPRTP